MNQALNRNQRQRGRCCALKVLKDVTENVKDRQDLQVNSKGLFLVLFRKNESMLSQL